MILSFSFLLGLCFGSFANVVIYRLPKGLSIVKPPSACPFCNHRLAPFELIPVISWLFLRGKCRKCKKRISFRYPLVELICGGLFAAMVCYSATLSAVPLMVLAFVLLVISFIDFDIQEIPDGLVIIGAISGVFLVGGGHFFANNFYGARAWHDALLGVIAGAVPLLIIDRITLVLLKKDGFGYGDVKLMAMVGLFLGWRLMFVAFFLAFISGGAFAVYLIAAGKAKRGAYMPFGPFLCVGALLAFWFGESLLELYIGALAFNYI